MRSANPLLSLLIQSLEHSYLSRLRIRRRNLRDIPYMLGIECHITYIVGINHHLIHLREGSRIFVFFPQNMTEAFSKKGESTIGAPSSGRQNVGVGAPIMNGKSTADAPNMKDKSVDLPREGKKAEKTSASIQFSRDKFGD